MSEAEIKAREGYTGGRWVTWLDPDDDFPWARFTLGHQNPDISLVQPAGDGFETVWTPMLNGWGFVIGRGWDLEPWSNDTIFPDAADHPDDMERVKVLLAVWMQSAAHELFELLHIDGMRYAAPHGGGVIQPSNFNTFMVMADIVLQRMLAEGHLNPSNAIKSCPCGCGKNNTEEPNA